MYRGSNNYIECKNKEEVKMVNFINMEAQAYYISRATKLHISVEKKKWEPLQMSLNQALLWDRTLETLKTLTTCRRNG